MWFIVLIAIACQGLTDVSGSVEIWRVSTVSDTSDLDKLIAPFHPTHHSWGDDSLGTSQKHPGALGVHYRQGSYTKTSHRGGGFYSTPSEVVDGVDNLILMYDVYFENFGWGKGGKLPGLFGGEKGEGAYKCSGGNNPSTCFSLRLMWRENGKGELYAYISDHQASDFDTRDDVITHHGFGQSIGRGKIHFRNGEWQTVLQQVHLNSSPDIADGYVKMCVSFRDGNQDCYTANNLVIRKDRHHHLRGVFFSTFFGGSSHDYAAPHDCHTYFKNFKLKYPSSDVHVG